MSFCFLGRGARELRVVELVRAGLGGRARSGSGAGFRRDWIDAMNKIKTAKWRPGFD